MATTLDALLAFALTLPDTAADVACAGTAIESRTATVRGRAFLFVGAGAIRLKLGESLPAATACVERDPARYAVGKGGWIKITATEAGLPSLALLQRWIRESHGLAAPAAARVQARAGAKVPRAKKKAAKKR